jgi:hypothetical protein
MRAERELVFEIMKNQRQVFLSSSSSCLSVFSFA